MSSRAKRIDLALLLALSSAAALSEPLDPCAALTGSSLDQCRASQQAHQQEKLDTLQERLQQQQQRQQELDEQQRQIQQQMQQMRLENENLRKQLESQPAASERVQTLAPNNPKSVAAKTAELRQWKAENPWYGSDYAKTEFASRYAKQLERERPDLVGRPLLDAISLKVTEAFGTQK